MNCSLIVCTLIACTGYTNIYIAYWPKTTIAVGGSDINITCYAVSRDNRLTVGFRFRRGNDILPSHAHGTVNRYVTSSSLQLHNVSQSDNGEYSCQLLDIVESDWRAGSLIVYEGIATCNNIIL